MCLDHTEVARVYWGCCSVQDRFWGPELLLRGRGADSRQLEPWLESTWEVIMNPPLQALKLQAITMSEAVGVRYGLCIKYPPYIEGVAI